MVATTGMLIHLHTLIDDVIVSVNIATAGMLDEGEKIVYGGQPALIDFNMRYCLNYSYLNLFSVVFTLTCFCIFILNSSHDKK